MPDYTNNPEPISWYRELVLDFADGTSVTMLIERKPTGTHIPMVSPAPWTKLGFNKCPCCPIPGERGACPAAVSMQTTLDQLRARTSTEIVTATAVDEQGRKQTVTAPLQMVGAIMVQLAVFSSECPVGRKLKPYLNGLPPFADSDELIQHVLKTLRGGDEAAVEGSRKDIQDIIRPLHEVFVYLGRRLRGGEEPHQDAIPNSIVHLDALAQMMAFQANRLNKQMAHTLGWEKKVQPAAPAGMWARLRSFFGSK